MQFIALLAAIGGLGIAVSVSAVSLITGGPLGWLALAPATPFGRLVRVAAIVGVAATAVLVAVRWRIRQTNIIDR